MMSNYSTNVSDCSLVELPQKHKIKKMKSILLKILTIISPVIILATLGIMQGVWFDVEEYIERGDTDVFSSLFNPISIVLFSKYSLVCTFLAAAKT